MVTRKCPACAEKIDKKFRYCPWCGVGIKNIKDKKDYGMLGKSDNIDTNMFASEMKLPIDINSILKQLEKEMGSMSDGQPHRFNIKIQTGGIPMPANVRQPVIKKETTKITQEEAERRNKLPKKIAKSKVKRFSDNIVYEIEVDEVKEKSQINIIKLESGFEIRIFGKEYCFVKSIPLNMTLVGYKILKDKVLVEFKE